MGNTLVMMLMDLTDRYEFRVRPFDSRWEAIVSDYGYSSDDTGEAFHGERTFVAVASTPNEALQAALLLSRKTTS